MFPNDGLRLLSHCFAHCLIDSASVHGIDALMVPYSRIAQQQLLPLDQNSYSTDLYRQGLTPPQLPGDHLHPYGELTHLPQIPFSFSLSAVQPLYHLVRLYLQRAFISCQRSSNGVA